MKRENLDTVPIDLYSKFYIPESILFRKLESESVLLNLDSEMYYGLDEVGTRMWVALESSETITAAHEHLLSDYDVDSDQLQEDLIELVSKLLESKLISFSKM